MAAKTELPNLEYSMKHRDSHRRKYNIGDWTDDSDQMILILLSLLHNNGKVSIFKLLLNKLLIFFFQSSSR